MYQYPYGNAQQLNLDWLLGKIQEIQRNQYATTIEEVANALISASYAVQNYNRSDIVFYNGKLYRANQNITAEAWDSAHWDEILLGDTVANLVRYVSSLDNSQVVNSSTVAGTHTSDALNTLATKTMLPINPCLKESKLIAHQGSTSFVQSTDLCFKNAVMQGFKIIEGDVRKTSDNNFVIWHDTTAGGLTIENSTLAQIQALTFDYECKIMTLQDFLKLCIQNGVVAELDLSLSHMSDADFNTYKQDLYNIVKSINPPLDSVIWTGNYLKLMYMQQVDPTVIMCYSGLTSMDAIGPNVQMISRNSRFMMFSMNNAQINPDIINWAHSNGYYIKTYTIDTVTKLFNTFANGADYAIVESILPAADKYANVGGKALIENWIYDGRITLTNEGVANGVRLVNNNVLHLMVHAIVAKAMAANQTSILTFPACFTPVYPQPTIALTGAHAGALNTPYLASATQNGYLNVTHGGNLAIGQHIVISLQMVIPAIIATFPALS